MQTTPITDLITNWRRTADELARSGRGNIGPSDTQWADCIRDCAAELEAILPKLEDIEVLPARRGDPSTSQAAARRITAENTRGKMLLAFYRSRSLDMPGLSAHQATRLARLEHLASPWKRVSELKLAGLVEATGRQVRGSRGQMQEELVLTDHGKAEAERIMPQACAALVTS